MIRVEFVWVAVIHLKQRFEGWRWRWSILELKWGFWKSNWGMNRNFWRFKLKHLGWERRFERWVSWCRVGAFLNFGFGIFQWFDGKFGLGLNCFCFFLGILNLKSVNFIFTRRKSMCTLRFDSNFSLFTWEIAIVLLLVWLCVFEIEFKFPKQYFFW